MADETLQVEFCAPDVDPVQMEVVQVVVPGAGGVFTVLADHTPLLSTLIPGVLITLDAHGVESHYAVSGGFAEVLDNHVTILANALETGDDVDKERAKEALERAEKRLAKPSDDTDVKRAEYALARSFARLQAQSRQGY